MDKYLDASHKPTMLDALKRIGSRDSGTLVRRLTSIDLKNVIVMTDILDTLLHFHGHSMCETSDVFVFGQYTVISGYGGLLGHAHAIEQVEITPDLRALGAVFAFTQTQAVHLHAHGGTYYVKKPADGCNVPNLYQFLNGASVQTRFLNRSALHCHRIHVIYTPTTPTTTTNKKIHRKNGTRMRKGDEKRNREYDDLVDIGKAMGSHAYQTEKYATPVIDVDVCGRCSRVREKRREMSHALLVFR